MSESEPVTKIEWTLWVFAGPGALSGLIRDDDDLGLVVTSPGEAIPLRAMLERMLGGEGTLPSGVKIIAETIGEPTLLQRLTGEWPVTRLVCEPGASVSTASEARGERDLVRFIEWAHSHTPEGSRRGLVVLGELLQAIGDEPAPAVGDALGIDRPTYPGTVVIKKKDASVATYTRGPTGLYSGLTSEALLAEATAQDVEAITGSDPFTVGTRDSSLAELVELAKYSGVGDTNTTRSLDARSLQATSARTQRRIDALVEALHDSKGALRALDLLATDDCELTQLGVLRRLAPHVEVFVGSQLGSPVAERPLGDLLEALSKHPGASPEAVAKETVARSQANGKVLWRRAESLLADPRGHTRPTTPVARELLMAGHDAVALRGAKVGGLVDAVDAFAGQALTWLDPGGESQLAQELGHCLESARARQVDVIPLLQPLDSPLADGLKDAAAAVVIERREWRPLATQPSLLCGVDLELSASGCLPASSRWAELLDAVGAGPRRPQSEAERRVQDDLQVWSARTSTSRRIARPVTPNEPYLLLDYDAGSGANEPGFAAEHHLQAFLAKELHEHASARHLSLVVRGRTTKTRPYSLALGASGEYLSIATLAECVREALNAHGRGPLAMLVLEDSQLMSLEVAYELREVAHVLVTGVEDSSGALSVPADLDVRACEAAAVAQLDSPAGLDAPAGRMLAPIAREWQRDVARRLAARLYEGARGTVQAINLQYVEALCRRFDWVCQIMLDHLDEPFVRAMLEAGFAQDRLIWLLNRAQNGLYTHWDPCASDLNLAMGAVYNWIRYPGKPVEQGGVPFWIGEVAPEQDPRIYASRLRIDVEPKRPKDYLALSFHQDVRLHALLVAWRLLASAKCEASGLWGLVSLGLFYAPARTRNAQLEQLGADPNASRFFTTFGAPPLMTLSIESDTREGQGYELRLSSSESAATLLRQRSQVDLGAVTRSLDGLSALISRGGASSAGWRYLESLGASLAEDVICGLHEQLERERVGLLDTGRGRDVHLALALPRELMRYPWELMQLPAGALGKPAELLADRFVVGRQMWSERGLRRIRRDEPIRVLIIGDPPTGSGSSLPGAHEEAELVATICEAANADLAGEMDFDRKRDAFIGETMTRAALRRIVREGRYDVLHFAGHGTFASGHPERSGWLLSDGLLTVTELRNTLAWCECPPWLVFANACDAGMTSDRPASGYQGEIHGIAEACIREGVNAFIGPLWRINDESARLLAAELYRCLLLRRTTIGVAMHRARASVRKAWEATSGDAIGDISWAGMVLFGNPTARLNETATP